MFNFSESSFLELLVFTNALLFAVVTIAVAGFALLALDYLRAKSGQKSVTDTVLSDKRKAQ